MRENKLFALVFEFAQSLTPLVKILKRRLITMVRIKKISPDISKIMPALNETRNILVFVMGC